MHFRKAVCCSGLTAVIRDWEDGPLLIIHSGCFMVKIHLPVQGRLSLLFIKNVRLQMNYGPASVIGIRQFLF